MSTSVSPDTPDPRWRAVPLLAALPEERLHSLWTASAPGRYAAGEALRNAGDPATHLLVLLHGRVAATATTPAGRTLRHGEWSGPCALDKIAVIDGHGHTATLTALTPCAVRALPRERFLALVDDVAAVRAHVIHVLAEAARHAQDRFAATAALPAEARLAAWLLAQAATTATVPLPGGTQQALADHLGTTRVTLNRALARLRRDGLIELRGAAIRVLAPELLQLRAAR
ncbi:Crp/Fnr family transcriptional regulator [Streptomyces sp. 6N223]|uniref:Crp/Fnr family transcriptional regulator n=1 Tax=Streptomyces sp. 6N223 TaxID=3457412 RepID=UPI003FD4D56A